MNSYDMILNDAFTSFDRLFGQAFGGNGRASLFGGAVPGVPVDLFDDGDRFTVRAEVPGVDREDLRIELNDGVLRIFGERKVPGAEENPRSIKFERSIRMRDEVDRNAIRARLVDGILEIELPKAEAAKPVAITIE